MNKHTKVIVGVVAAVLVIGVAFAVGPSGMFQGRLQLSRPILKKIDPSKLFLWRNQVVSVVASPVVSAVTTVVASPVSSNVITSITTPVASGVTSDVTSAVTTAIVTYVTSQVTSQVSSEVTSQVTSAVPSQVASVVTTPVASAVASAVVVKNPGIINIKNLKKLTEDVLKEYAKEDAKNNPKKYIAAAKEAQRQNPKRFNLPDNVKKKLLEMYNSNKKS